MSTVTHISPEQKTLVLDAFADEFMAPEMPVFRARIIAGALVVNVAPGAEHLMPETFHDLPVRVVTQARRSRTRPLSAA